jgi:hypothetical protein
MFKARFLAMAVLATATPVGGQVSPHGDTVSTEAPWDGAVAEEDGPNPEGAMTEATDALASAADEMARMPEPYFDPNTWMMVATDANQTRWSIRLRDLPTQVVTETKRVWAQLDHSRDATVSHRRSMYLINFMCATGQTSTVAVVEYDASGNTVSSREEAYARARYVVPGSVVEGAYDAVCGVLFQ